MTRQRFLSTFLFAAVLSPIILQPYTCGPPPELARLSALELRVGSFAGENVVEGFSPNIFSYDVHFPESESVGVLWVKTNHPSTMVDVEYDGLPVHLVGQSVAALDVPLGISELAIHVTRRGANPDTKTYLVHVKRVPMFPCTEQGIRDAIAYGGGPNYFDCDGPTQVPTAAEIVIDNDVILDGEGNMLVDAGGGAGGTGGNGAGGGGGAFMAAEVAPKANGPHRVFSIPEGVAAELNGFTITGGSTAGDGGGILNAGTFALTDGTVTGNTADRGGGVHNAETGTLIVTDCNVSQNTAQRFAGGLNNRGRMDVTNSVVSGNEADLGSGGVSNFPEVAIMTLTRTTVTGNTTGGSGGGIGNTGTATLNETTMSGNHADDMGGGVRNNGDLTLVNSMVTGNTSDGDGGGIMVSQGIITLNNTAVSGNESGNFGGGIQNTGTVVLNDSSVSENIASVNAGGLANGDTGIVTLNNSTVSGNTAAFFGGGLLNAGSMTVTSTSVLHNLGPNGGGGIINQGTLTVLNSAVSDNAATSGGGGGIHNGGTMTLTSSTVTGNQAGDNGGGIDVDGSVTATNSTISANSAGEFGGGIFSGENGILTVTRCNVSDNTAGSWTGGIRSFGFAQIIDTTISNNTAVNGTGGISNRAPGTMAITGVTLSENVIANSGAMTVTNTTVSTDGVGITNRGPGPMTMVSTTVSGVRNTGAMTLRNNIIDGGCELTAPLESFGGNIESPGNTCGLGHPTDRVGVTPTELALDSLDDNGGPTWTRALLPGSVAIGLANECVNVAGFPLLVDQRGAPRPYGAACDSGAFELGAVPLPRDLCIDDADRAVYESLEYIDAGGNLSTCTDAANSITADCALIGCPDEVAAVIACFPSCSPDVIAAFDQCVADCTEGATGLSTECAGCYGGWAGCGAEVCVPECAGGGTQPQCIDCLSAAGCTERFNACSGVPGNIDCPPASTQPTVACVNDADQAVYESLTYIDGQGEFFTCIDAASAIGSDCVFGSPQSEPPLEGCSSEALDVLQCFPNCPEEVIEAFGACVASCTTGATGLSSTCAGCYGDAAGCAAAFCTTSCVGDLESPTCVECRTQNGCIPGFDECSGLPGDVDCSLIPNLCEGADCDDQNQCTEDRCNYSDGTCSNDPVPNGWFCDLGGGVPGLCTDGECIEDFCWSNPCDDGNQCTFDECDPGAGECIHDPVPRDGSPCDLLGIGDGICTEGVCHAPA